jgi:hypothetical protein
MMTHPIPKHKVIIRANAEQSTQSVVLRASPFGTFSAFDTDGDEQDLSHNRSA